MNWRIVPLSHAFAGALGVSLKEAQKVAKAQPMKLDDFVLRHPDQVVQMGKPDYKNISADARVVVDQSLKNPDKTFLLERSAHSDMYFKNGKRYLFYRAKLKDIDGDLVTGEPLTTIWDDLLSNNLHKEGSVSFPKGKKPESLIKRCLELATEPGDLVLDSFLGSGTTAAAAHKTGRQWIGIELGDHCDTHCVPRLKRIIDGTDQDGISKAVDWKGGGGFRYYKLAPSLLEKDKWDNWVISKEYNAGMLAEAICKLEGFTYAPSDSLYWQQGHSTERDFLYVTTASLTHAQLQQLSDEVGSERTLLVVCTSFRGSKEGYPNLTVKKVPKAVLNRCEWGKDDYSLRVENLPAAPPKPGQQDLF